MNQHAHVERRESRWVLPTGASPDGFGVRVVHDGSTQVVWSCPDCDYTTSPLPHYLAEDWGIDIGRLRIVADYSGRFGRCSVHGCPSNDAQLHHFAPTGIFGEDADRWPMGFLCREHHAEWHRRVTPGLVR